MGGRKWIKPFDGSPYEAYMAYGDKKYNEGFAKGYAEGFIEGFAIGYEEGISETINRLHDVKGLSASEIVESTGYSLDRVEAALSKRVG